MANTRTWIESWGARASSSVMRSGAISANVATLIRTVNEGQDGINRPNPLAQRSPAFSAQLSPRTVSCNAIASAPHARLLLSPIANPVWRFRVLVLATFRIIHGSQLQIGTGLHDAPKSRAMHQRHRPARSIGITNIDGHPPFAVFLLPHRDIVARRKYRVPINRPITSQRIG